MDTFHQIIVDKISEYFQCSYFCRLPARKAHTHTHIQTNKWKSNHCCVLSPSFVSKTHKKQARHNRVKELKHTHIQTRRKIQVHVNNQVEIHIHTHKQINK